MTIFSGVRYMKRSGLRVTSGERCGGVGKRGVMRRLRRE